MPVNRHNALSLEKYQRCTHGCVKKKEPDGKKAKAPTLVGLSAITNITFAQAVMAITKKQVATIPFMTSNAIP